MKIRRKSNHHKSLNPPKWVFSKTNNHRAMKLGTHTQVPNTNTPAEFQGHPPIITLFTPHMCDFQGH